MVCTMWTKYILFLLIGSQMGAAFSLSCGNNTILDIVAGQQSMVTCYSKEVKNWRIATMDESSFSIAFWGNRFEVVNDFNEAFNIENIRDRQSPLIINPLNKKVENNVVILNGTLLCDAENCGLNYVDPPEDVRCTAVVLSWNVTVSCNITKTYSSRRIYNCQLFRVQRSISNDSLQTINMVTSPTDDSVGNNEVKVSGYCRFNSTQLPERNGSYSYYVHISSGRTTHKVDLPANFPTWLSVDWPSSPQVTCQPQHYVLENTNVICTCKTSSLGNPAGSLMWVTDDERISERLASGEVRGDKPEYIYYNQTLTKTDHNKTWIRCDVQWGSQRIEGQTYRANVAYGPRDLRLYLNYSQSNVTVTEAEHESVQMMCYSDGNPLPNMTLRNADNGTVIAKALSSVSHNVKTRCENGGLYQCSARTDFSPEQYLTYLFLVRCKPRPLSPKVVISPKNTTFDVIAYPKPVNFTVWYLGNTSNTTADPPNDKVSVKPIFCSPRPMRRYQFSCNWTFDGSAADTAPGFYSVRVMNEVDGGRFTVEVQNDVPPKDDPKNGINNGPPTAVIGGVAALAIVVIIVVFAIVVVIVRRKGKVPLQMNRLATRADIVRVEPRDSDHNVRAAGEKEMDNDLGPSSSQSCGLYDNVAMPDSISDFEKKHAASSPECAYDNIGELDSAITATDKTVERKTDKKKRHKKDWKAVFTKTTRQEQDTVPLRDSETLCAEAQVEIAEYHEPAEYSNATATASHYEPAEYSNATATASHNDPAEYSKATVTASHYDSAEYSKATVTASHYDPPEYSKATAIAAAAGDSDNPSTTGKRENQGLVYTAIGFKPSASNKPAPVRERTDYSEIIIVNSKPTICD